MAMNVDADQEAEEMMSGDEEIILTAQPINNLEVKVNIPSPSPSQVGNDQVPPPPIAPVMEPSGLPCMLSFPLQPISFTQEDRINAKYVDLLITTSPAEVSPGSSEGDNIFGHRIILEQIPFFKPKLGHTAGEIDIIQVPGLNPVAVEAVISMYYTQELIFPSTCSLDDIFQVLETFEIKSNRLTCWALRADAVARNDKWLLETTDGYITRNFAKAIVEHEDFLHINFDQLLRYISEGVKSGSSPQIVLLTGVVKWASFNIELRMDKIYPLVKLLDIAVMFHESPASRESLRQLYARGSVLASIPACRDLHWRALAEEAYELANKDPGLSKVPSEPVSVACQSQNEEMDESVDDNDQAPPEDDDDDDEDDETPQGGSFLEPPEETPEPMTPSGDLGTPNSSKANFQVRPLEDLMDTDSLPRRRVQNEILLYPVADKTGFVFLEAFDFREKKAYPRLHRVTRPRDFCCLLQVGNKVYDMGGADGSNGPHLTIWDDMVSTADVNIYDKGELLPKKGKCLVENRRSSTAHFLEGSIYIIGGEYTDDASSQSFVSNVMEELRDPTSGIWKWKISSYLQVPRSCHASAFLGDKLYVAGGIGTNSSALKSVEVFNPLAPVWKYSKNMLVGRRCFRLHVMGLKMYAIGGEDKDGGVLKSAEVYDLNTNTWTRLTPMIYGRSNFGLLEMNGRIYVIGGNERGRLSIEAYDPDDNAWSILPWPEGLNPMGKLSSSISLSRDYIS